MTEPTPCSTMVHMERDQITDEQSFLIAKLLVNDMLKDIQAGKRSLGGLIQLQERDEDTVVAFLITPQASMEKVALVLAQHAAVMDGKGEGGPLPAFWITQNAGEIVHGPIEEAR